MSKQTLEQKFETFTPARLFKWLTVIVAVGVTVVATVLTFYLVQFNDKLSPSNSDWGTFGDFFGGTLNPILSFLSLIALLFTIVLQSKELEATRIELNRAASAQEKTEKALNTQSRTQVKQQFEGTFFSLLEQHNKALEKLSAHTGQWSGGASSLDIICKAVFDNRTMDLESAKRILEKHNDLCGNYFRILYQLLKFVATNCPGSEIGQKFEAKQIQNSQVGAEEKMYSNMVRSFLSYDTTQLLAINCFCQDPNDTYWRYRLLIERYAFLEHMPFKINATEHALLVAVESAYTEAAFGNSVFRKKTATV